MLRISRRRAGDPLARVLQVLLHAVGCQDQEVEISLRACLAVVATVTLLGCGLKIRTTPLSGPYPPRPADAEVLVWSVAIPECPFEEVGLLTVREGYNASGPAVLVGMKQEARRMGGDALIGLRPAPGGERGLYATVVRCSSPECRR